MWNGAERMDAINRQAAEMLLRIVVLFENTHRNRVGKANPPPYTDSSKPGEYPRLRTGGGQRGLTHEPASVAEVMKTGVIRVGFTTNARHMLILELARDRKGLLDTLADLRPVMAQMAKAAKGP